MCITHIYIYIRIKHVLFKQNISTQMGILFRNLERLTKLFCFPPDHRTENHLRQIYKMDQ